MLKMSSREVNFGALGRSSLQTHEEILPSSADSLTQTLTALRAEDPGFGKVVSTRRVERGDVVASAE